MLTLDKLIDYGIDVKGPVNHFKEEENYLVLVENLVVTPKIEEMEFKINKKLFNAALVIANRLYRAYSVLNLNKVSDVLDEIIKHLEVRDDIDYSFLLGELDKYNNELIELTK